MKTCVDCKDEACPDMGNDVPSCEDFTSKAIKENPVEWQPTLEDYNWAISKYKDLLQELFTAQRRIESFEKAIAELVKWASGEETL